MRELWLRARIVLLLTVLFPILSNAQEERPTASDQVVAERSLQLKGRLLAEFNAPADEDEKTVQTRLDRLIADAEALLEITVSDRLTYECLSVYLQASHLRITRWPEDAGNQRRINELRASARRVKSVKRPDAVTIGDFWLMTAELIEIKRSTLSTDDKQLQSEQVLRSFLLVHRTGPVVDSARSALQALIESGNARAAEKAIPSAASGDSSAEPDYRLGKPSPPDAGLIRVPITCRYQGTQNTLRILVPRTLGDPDAPQARLLLVLPAEKNDESEFGDPLDSIRAADLHNRYNLVVVIPTVAGTPWYADHPSDPAQRQASYITRAVMPAVRELYPDLPQRALLLGFSRSGWGATSLLCRFPGLFEAAAVWDAPLSIEAMSLPGMESVFATQEQFARSALPAQFRSSAATLRKKPRLALMGHYFFFEQMRDAHRLLDDLGIPHIYDEKRGQRHHWEPDWVEQAVESLIEMTSTPDE